MSPAISRTIVVARSKEGNDELMEKLPKEEFTVIPVETIRFAEPEDWSEVDSAISRVSHYDWLLFTSPRGAMAFGKRAAAAKVELGGRIPKVAAVGALTAGALRSLGLKVAFVPSRHLTQTLSAELPLNEGRRVAIFRTELGDKSLASSLVDRGFQVDDLTIYRTVLVSGDVEPRVAQADFVVFASPSEVKGFVERLAPSDFREVSGRATAVCIGPVTEDAARSAGFRTTVQADEQSAESLAHKVGRMATNA